MTVHGLILSLVVVVRLRVWAWCYQKGRGTVVGGKEAWRKRDKNQTLPSGSPSSRLKFRACFDYFSGYPNDMVMVVWMFARVPFCQILHHV
jgi:hypothetical protein